jgi:hypothetical protein
MPACLEWAYERYEECNEWRDEGHNECNDWDDRCCDWWPCSWGCRLITWICIGFVWVASWICVGWTVITTAVCVVWDIVTAVINAVLVTIESIVGWVISAVGFIIELIEAIPIIGALIKWIINIITWLVWTIVSIADLVLGLIGIRPEKKLRVCTVILSDENAVPTAMPDYAIALLQKAADVYKRDANVRLVPLAPFQYDSGFAGAEMVTDDWVKTDGGKRDAAVLDSPCDAGELWTTGSIYQFIISTNCFYGSWRRIVGYGAPIAFLIVRNIPNAYGCAPFFAGYAKIDGGRVPPPNLRVAGHEAGHLCNLWFHDCVDDDAQNIMGTGDGCDPESFATPDYGNPRMSNWQVLRVRASKHVTYF